MSQANQHNAVDLLQLKLLGGFALLLPGRVGDGLSYEKARGLLAFLALGATPQIRKHLAALFWPDLPASAALSNLRIVLLDLRKALNHGDGHPLEVDRDVVRLDSAAIRVDAVAFMQPLKECACRSGALPCNTCVEQLERRAALYEGDFLDGFSLPDCPEFEDWISLQREALRRIALERHRELAEIHEARCQLAPAIAHAQRYVAIARWDESGQRRLMRLFDRAGQSASALAQYESLRRLLAEDLAVQPEDDTRKLAESIARKAAAQESVDRPSLSVAPVAAPVTVERRQVTVVYCELSAPGADEAFDVLYPLQQRWAERLVSRGGHVVQTYTGALLAYFGFPSASERAARDAMGAALEIVGDAPAGVSVRVGVHSGMVAGGGTQAVPDIVGTTTTLAIRLRLLAAPGSIVVSSDAACLVSGYFDFVPLGACQVAGLPTPVDTLRLVGETGAGDRLAAAAALTPLVGRHAELRLLSASWHRSRRGHPQFILVRGEAGIGKSRLLLEFRRSLQGEVHILRELRCSPEFSGSPFHPVATLIEQVLDLSDDDDDVERGTRLTTYLEARHRKLRPDERKVVAAMLQRLPDESVAAAADSLRDALLSLLPKLLADLAERSPLLLIVEDLHWSDPSTLELMQRLLVVTGRAQIMVVFTARPEFAPSWPAQAVRELPLSRITVTETRTLVETLAPQLSADVVDCIADRADGVPLFAEELARMAAGSGAEDIPATLQDLLASQLDRLGSAKQTAQLAATIGRSFSGELLRCVSPLAADVVGSHLATLVAANLLVPQRSNSYQFRHALIRDVAYQSQTNGVRQEAHRRLATALQRDTGRGMRSHPELVASHYEAAGEWSLAAAHWLAAANHASRHAANHEALHHYRAGLQLIGRLPAVPSTRRLEFDLQNGLGVTALAVDGYGSLQATQAHERAAALCENVADSPDRYRALWGLWASASSRAGYGHALDMAQHLLRVAEQSGNSVQLQQANFAMGNTLFWQGQLVNSRLHLETALAGCRPTHRAVHLADFGEDLRATATSYLSWVLELAGQPEEARRTSEAAVAHARQIHHPFSLGYALTFAALLHCRQGEPERAMAIGEEVLTLAATHDFPLWRIGGHLAHGWGSAVSGGEAGFEEISLCLEATRSVMSGVSLLVLNLLASAQLSCGRYSEALETIGQALATGRDLQDSHLEAELLRMKGDALIGLSRANTAAARECYDAALALALDQGADSLTIRIRDAMSAAG